MSAATDVAAANRRLLKQAARRGGGACSASASRWCRSTRRSARWRASATCCSPDDAAGEHAGRHRAHGHDRVRLEHPRRCRGRSSPLAAQRAGPSRASSTTVMYEVRNTLDRAGHRPGGAELRAAARGAVLQEARVLLLHAADARAGRGAADAGRVRDRSERCRTDVNTITLSYTFFEVAGRGRSADSSRAAASGADPGHGDRRRERSTEEGRTVAGREGGVLVVLRHPQARASTRRT